METRKHYQVVAAVIEHAGRVLCMQHDATRHSYTSWRWEFPGGKIEPGETPQQALRREILEELDLQVQVHEHLATVQHSYPDFDITLQFYRCTAATTAIVRREHASHCWLPPGELHTLQWAAADARMVATCFQPQ